MLLNKFTPLVKTNGKQWGRKHVVKLEPQQYGMEPKSSTFGYGMRWKKDEKRL